MNPVHAKTATCCESLPQEDSVVEPNNLKSKYYCPMHCEGDKIYDKAGNCPVCGMILQQIPDVNSTKIVYTCPMHSDVIKENSGSCPICGMDLIPLEPFNSQENQEYKAFFWKMKTAIFFTLPIFIIAMLEMVHGNPLLNVMSITNWNWVQLFLSLPVVFYACNMFFVRAWEIYIESQF